MRCTYDVRLWPWPLTLEVTAIVGHTHLGSQSTKCKFCSMTHTGQTYHVTLWPWPLTLQVMALASDAGLRLYVLHPHTHGVPSCQFWWYYDYSFSIYGPTRLRQIMWPCDPDLWGHGACGWYGSSSSIRIPSLKFVGLGIRRIWRTMCVSINGPGNIDLWPFDLITGTQVASKVGNFPSKFGHVKPMGSRIIRCVYDGRTDGRTDGRKQRLLPPSLRPAHHKRDVPGNTGLSATGGGV